jgi:hypothetical protein
MSTRYRIASPDKRPLTDAEINAHKDAGRLFHNYHKVAKPLYKRPLYKEPWTFVALLIIVLIVILIAEAAEKEERMPAQPDRQENPN